MSKPRTVKVRIAVAVAADGWWRASGNVNRDDHDAASEARIYQTDHVYFIEADLARPPMPPTITGRVTKAKGAKR